MKLSYALLIESYRASTDGVKAIGERELLVAGGVEVLSLVSCNLLKLPSPASYFSQSSLQASFYLYTYLYLNLIAPFTMAPKVAIIYVSQLHHCSALSPFP